MNIFKRKPRRNQYTRLVRAAKRLVDFCYGFEGAWIGAKAIAESTTFLNLINELYLAVRELEGRKL